MCWFLSIFIVLVGGWAAARAWRTRFSFRDKVVVITGGSRGLGLVLARQVCDERGKVALIARDGEGLQRARQELTARGGEVLTISCDLLDRTQIQAAVEHILARNGQIDVLINDAGIIEVGPLDQMTREDFERCMGLHFWAPFELTMQILPQMRKQRSGRIVNISSIGGKVAVPHLAPYCASKFALTGFSYAVGAELAQHNIFATTVAPGLIRTGSHVNGRFKGQPAAEF